MKNIPLGKGALLIAHPGDELKLFGFINQAKPYLFILTDGSGRTRPATLNDTWRILNSIFPESGDIFYMMTQQDKEKHGYINNYLLYQEILNKQESFFAVYINQIVYNLSEKNIDYLVVNSREEYNPINELCRIMAEIAVKLVERGKGKKIMLYEFPVIKPYNEGINDGCIRINLDEELMKKKLYWISRYDSSVLDDLKLNVRIDKNAILNLKEMPGGLEEVENILLQVAPDFLKNEYLFPYIYKESSEKPFYEIYAERLVNSGIYMEAITYKSHILPIKKRLDSLTQQTIKA